MSRSDAEQLALVKSLVDQARRLGLIWTIRNATVVDGTDTGHVAVRFDGDEDTSYDVISIIGTIATGQRIAVISVPPAGQYIVGKLGASGYLMEVGTALITPVANTPTALAITFTQPFTSPPVVTTTPNTGVPGSNVLETSCSSITTTGCNIVIYRTNATATTVNWMAVQMVT